MVLTKFESLAEELDYIVVRLSKEVQRSLGANLEPFKNQKRAEKLALIVAPQDKALIMAPLDVFWLRPPSAARKKWYF